MIMSKLTFDPEAHEYRLNGVKVPNVTGILSPLQDFSMIPPDVLARAAQFGKHVNEACEMYDNGVLDREELDPALDEYLAGWIMFLDVCRPEITMNESKVHSIKYGYAGTLDRAAFYKKKLCQFDIKTGIRSAATGPQTAAYSKAHQEMTGERIKRRFTVLLRPNTFKLVEHPDKGDFNIFLSCLNIHNYLINFKSSVNTRNNV